MMQRFFAASAALLFVSASLFAAESDFKAHCPVSGEDADQSEVVAYNGGKVYLCCGDCLAEFQKHPAKYAAKANHQLVETKQAKEVKCPFSGRKLNPELTVEIAGVKVAFCCNNCKSKAANASGDEQLQLVFNDKAFAKGFELKKK